MSWEVPNDFKYGIYSDGNYLGSQELFKLNGVWWGLFVSMIVLATPFFAIGLMLLFIAVLITDTACSLVEG